MAANWNIRGQKNSSRSSADARSSSSGNARKTSGSGGARRDSGGKSGARGSRSGRNSSTSTRGKHTSSANTRNSSSSVKAKHTSNSARNSSSARFSRSSNRNSGNFNGEHPQALHELDEPRRSRGSRQNASRDSRAAQGNRSARDNRGANDSRNTRGNGAARNNRGVRHNQKAAKHRGSSPAFVAISSDGGRNAGGVRHKNERTKNTRANNQANNQAAYHANNRHSIKQANDRYSENPPSRAGFFNKSGQEIGESIISRANHSGRDWVLLIILALLFVCIITRLVWVQVIDASENAEKATIAHTNELVQNTKRGTIYDRNGETIASSVEATTIYANPKEIEKPEQVARIMQSYLESEYKLTYQDCYDLITKKDTSFVYIKRKADKELASKMQAELKEKKLNGIHYLQDYKRTYPNGDVGKQVVGNVDVDDIGISGLELQYEDVLSGTSSNNSKLEGLQGLPMVGSVVSQDISPQSDSIKVSLDVKLQQRCEERLLEAIENYKAQGGSVTVMDAGTGEIYATCSYSLQEKEVEVEVSEDEEGESQEGEASAGTGDSATQEGAGQDGENATQSGVRQENAAQGSSAQGDSTQTTKKKTVTKKEKVYAQDVGKISAISDAYEPGSTFKPLTATSVLANTDATADTTFDVPSSLKVYDSTVTDSHEHGDITLSFNSVMAQSSNIGMVRAGELVSNQQLYDTYSAFGIGQTPTIDFPGAATGLLAKAEKWDGVQEANITFGQGVSTSALQMTRAYGALQQKGILRSPHFLKEVLLDEQKTKETLEKYNIETTVADKQVCEEITGMLRGVVQTSEGTGEAAQIEGFDVVGKTGTAEIADGQGKYLTNKYNVSFGGWLEGSSSNLVCFVVINQPDTQEGGGPVCGPVFADIMSFAVGCYQIQSQSD